MQRRLGGEVERIEALGLRKSRQPNATLDVTTLAINALQFARRRRSSRASMSSCTRAAAVVKATL